MKFFGDVDGGKWVGLKKILIIIVLVLIFRICICMFGSLVIM